MNYISLRRTNKVSDSFYTGKNSMLKYRGYIYKCKRSYIYTTVFNSINKMRHKAINVSKQSVLTYSYS